MSRSTAQFLRVETEDSWQVSQSVSTRESREGWQKIKIGSAQNRLTQLNSAIHSPSDADTRIQQFRAQKYAPKSVGQYFARIGMMGRERLENCTEGEIKVCLYR